MTVCVICGKASQPESYCESSIKRLMRVRKLCFDCAFWTDLAKEHATDPNWFRIGSTSYIAASRLAEGQHAKRVWGKGFGGEEFFVQTHEGRLVRTDNLWHQGTMPDWLRKEYPSNARILTAEEYKLLKGEHNDRTNR